MFYPIAKIIRKRIYQHDNCFDPLVGGGTIYLIGFFLFRQFWPIDIIIKEFRLVSLESSSSAENKFSIFTGSYRGVNF